MKILEKIRMWWEFRKLDRELTPAFSLSPDHTPLELDQEQKIANGVANLKEAARKVVATQGYDGLKKVDLLEIAKVENAKQAKDRELKESIYVYSGADVKDDADKAKMVDKRINMYYDLQNKKEQRKLVSSIRQAGKAGDKVTQDNLIKEYHEKYGKKRQG